MFGGHMFGQDHSKYLHSNRKNFKQFRLVHWFLVITSYRHCRIPDQAAADRELFHSLKSSSTAQRGFAPVEDPMAVSNDRIL